MNIYRGPREKPFFDNLHENVDSKDLSKCLSTWHECIRVKVNVSKEHPKRQAIVHVEFEPADAISLHDNLIEGLMQRSAKLDAVIEKLQKVSQYLRKLNSMESSAELSHNSKELETIKQEVESVLAIARSP